VCPARVGRPRKLDAPVRVEVWVEEQVVRALDDIASSEGITRSELIRQILGSYASAYSSFGRTGNDDNQGESKQGERIPVNVQAKAIVLKEQIREEYQMYRHALGKVAGLMKYSLLTNDANLINSIMRLKDSRRRLLDMIARYPLRGDGEIEEIFDSVKELPKEIEEVMKNWESRQL